ncbi:MAG: dephospho-CoA kinase [Thermosynechococcaceae cyanobacterium]
MSHCPSARLHPCVIGLTGGIATGKTTVANYLANRHGLPILDADHYARDAVCIGSPAWVAIRERYGPDIVQPDGALNRPRLGHILFHDAMEKQWLETLIHPVVRDRLAAERMAYLDSPRLVMVIPLLFETQMTDWVTDIWVVYCDEPQQRRRLMDRNGLTLAEAQVRIASQMPIAEKCDRADVVLDNSGPVSALYAQIDRALQR